MVDTHAHIEMCEGTPDEIVARAAEAGVDRILTIGLTEETFDVSLAIADAHEGVFAAVGCHPNETTGFTDAMAEAIDRAAEHPKVRAIGETGLDFYRDSAPPDDQRRGFLAQIEIATRRKLPVSIHARGAEAECIDMLIEHGSELPAVILHCFSDAGELPRAVEAGFYCSFAGNVTFKNAPDLREAAANVPDELLLVETDSPFLAPMPNRGKRCEPAWVTLTAQLVAETRGVSYDELDALVTANAKRALDW
ncbi:MAG: TatD family hydrolase [Thermoleophilaceae bacterium]|nr:TatD family hydrolase [Thermoleophilaceae bacterium]